MNMAKVLHFPEPEVINLKVNTPSSFYGDQISESNVYVTPYASDPQDTIARHAIKVPFSKIVTKADGSSICPHCNTKYAGTQDRCSNQVQYYRMRDSYYWQRGIPKGSYDIAFVEIKESGCNEWLQWNLQDEFNLQKDFFEFVEFVGRITTDMPNKLTSYRDALPPGVSDQYRIIYLEQKLIESQCQIDRLNQFVDKIAQKMQGAGQNLTW